MNGKVFSFIASKGGVGKSTLSILLANYLAYFKGLKTVIIDGDPQGTIVRLRKQEEDLIEGTNEMYTVEQCLGGDIPTTVDIYKDEYDVVILDLAGTIMGKTQFVNYCQIECALVPFNCSDAAVEGLQQISEFFHKNILSLPDQNTKIKIMFNHVSKLTTRYKNYNDLRDTDPEVVKKSIEEFKQTGEFGSEYPLPFELADEATTIVTAPSALTGMMSSIKGEKAEELINKYKTQLESIYKFIMN